MIAAYLYTDRAQLTAPAVHLSIVTIYCVEMNETTSGGTHEMVTDPLSLGKVHAYAEDGCIYQSASSDVELRIEPLTARGQVVGAWCML